MSCCVSKLDLCRLVQESYKSPTFNFGDTDVTNDTFVYKVKIAGESFTEYPCTVIAPNIVVIDEYTLPVGNYIHEMLWTSSNGTELIFQGALKITSVGSCCGSNRNNTIKVIQNETVVRINVTESNITIENGEWGSIEGDINEQTDLIELVDNAVNDMATQTWVENQNYLTEETDPTVPSHVKSITTTDISNWNNKQNQLTAGTNISIVGNTISSTVNLNGYATETWVNSQGFSKFSGSYNDLTNKPTIPTVGNGTITITQGGVLKGSFTTNQSGNTTVEVDAGGGGGADLMINTTHADLLALVNTNSLVAGQQYRITDYVATVNDDRSQILQSQGNQFDIIVTADSFNKLNENARAIRHEGDTYFPSTTIFEAWDLNYTIFNDINRFNHADSINGKGVIYRLIDEFNNDLPFDFKGYKVMEFDIDGNEVGFKYIFSDDTNIGVDNSLLGNNMNNTYKSKGSYYVLEGVIFKGTNSNINIQANNQSYILVVDNCNDINIDNYQKLFLTNSFYCNFNEDVLNSVITNLANSNFEGLLNVTYINTSLIYQVRFITYGVVSDVDLLSQLSNFTTTPNSNTVEVIYSASGNIIMQQRVSASVTEAFDVV